MEPLLHLYHRPSDEIGFEIERATVVRQLKLVSKAPPVVNRAWFANAMATLFNSCLIFRILQRRVIP